MRYVLLVVRAVVTGASGGIGVEIVRGLVGAGAEVIAAVRDRERATAALGALASRVRIETLDLASLASIRAFVAGVPSVDVLVNNAGVWSRQRRATADGFELTFGVNHVGHFALTAGLLSRVSRVVTVASGIHVRGKLAFDDLMQANTKGYNGVRAYEQSKLANVMFALALARRTRGVLSNAIHPGIVKTNLTREYPEMFRDTPAKSLVPAAVAARNIVRLALDTKTTGRYIDRDRDAVPSKAAQSVADQDRLWRMTEELLR